MSTAEVGSDDVCLVLYLNVHQGLVPKRRCPLADPNESMHTPHKISLDSLTRGND